MGNPKSAVLFMSPSSTPAVPAALGAGSSGPSSLLTGPWLSTPCGAARYHSPSLRFKKSIWSFFLALLRWSKTASARLRLPRPALWHEGQRYRVRRGAKPPGPRGRQRSAWIFSEQPTVHFQKEKQQFWRTLILQEPRRRCPPLSRGHRMTSSATG